MSYVKPADLVVRMVDAGAYKLQLSTRDTLIRAFMGAALLTMAAAFAVTVSTNTGQPLLGALLFPVGFVILYLFGFDLHGRRPDGDLLHLWILDRAQCGRAGDQ